MGKACGRKKTDRTTTKNVTVQPDFTLSDLLAVIETKNQESKDQQSPPSLFEHGKGNFSGAALTMLMGQRATRALANGAHLQTTLNSNALSLGSEWLEWCGVLEAPLVLSAPRPLAVHVV